MEGHQTPEEGKGFGQETKGKRKRGKAMEGHGRPGRGQGKGERNQRETGKGECHGRRRVARGTVRGKAREGKKPKRNGQGGRPWKAMKSH